MTRPVIVGRYTWAGGHDPNLTTRLAGSPHHWDGDQLVLHDGDREIRPEPGYLIVLWSDGMAHAVSPRVAERAYQPRPTGDRVPLGHLTSDQYDQLCDDLDRYRRAADPELQQRLEAAIRALGKSETELAQLRADIAACREQQWPQRLGQAEKALSRARAECDRIEAAVRANPQSPDFDGAYLAALGHILAALDEPKEPTP